MNRSQLRAQMRTDFHRSSYSDADLDNYISRGEGFIRARLRAYALSYTFTDADRVVANGPEYTLPGSVVKERTLLDSSGTTLDKRDEKTIDYYKSASTLLMYVMRPTTILFAGTPGAGTTIKMNYLGIPPTLPETSSNSLADDYPQLYLHAAGIYLFQRAVNLEAAAFHEKAARDLITEINKKFKALLGSGESAPVYNTSFRSSY